MISFCLCYCKNIHIAFENMFYAIKFNSNRVDVKIKKYMYIMLWNFLSGSILKLSENFYYLTQTYPSQPHWTHLQKSCDFKKASKLSDY